MAAVHTAAAPEPRRGAPESIDNPRRPRWTDQGWLEYDKRKQEAERKTREAEREWSRRRERERREAERECEPAHDPEHAAAERPRSPAEPRNTPQRRRAGDETEKQAPAPSPASREAPHERPAPATPRPPAPGPADPRNAPQPPPGAAGRDRSPTAAAPPALNDRNGSNAERLYRNAYPAEGGARDRGHPARTFPQGAMLAGKARTAWARGRPRPHVWARRGVGREARGGAPLRRPSARQRPGILPPRRPGLPYIRSANRADVFAPADKP